MSDIVFGVSTQGNTQGNTGTTNGTLLLVGSANITLSQVTDAAGIHTVKIVGGGGAGPGDGFNFISAGTQVAITNTTIVFSNSNNVSFGMSNSSIVTASIPSGATATGNFGAISAGTQQGSSGTVIFSNSNNVSFGMSGSSRVTATASYSQSTSPAAIAAGTQTATSGTILFSGSNGISVGMNNSSVVTAAILTLSMFENLVRGYNQVNYSQSTLMLSRISVEGFLTATKYAEILQVVQSADSFAMAAGIYSLTNSTLTLLSSTAYTRTWTSGGTTSDSSDRHGVSGIRFHTVTLNNWAITPGEYVFGIIYNATGAIGYGPIETFNLSGDMLTELGFFNHGLLTVGTNLPPSSIHFSDLNCREIGKFNAFTLVGTF